MKVFMENSFDCVLLDRVFHELFKLPELEVVIGEALLACHIVVIFPSSEDWSRFFEDSLRVLACRKSPSWHIFLSEVYDAWVNFKILRRITWLYYKCLTPAAWENRGDINLAIIFHVFDHVAVDEEWLLIAELLFKQHAPILENHRLSLLKSLFNHL